MATLYDLAMQYLNQSLPKTFKYDRTNQPGTTPPVTVPPQDPNAPVKKILPVQGSGGDGFSVYNPDPNSIANKNYSPYAYRQAAERNLIGDVYSSGTAAQKMMDNYPDYYTGPQLTGIPGAISNYAENSFLGKGLDALGNMLPVNKRAILENELSGQGIMVNDIGQIVQGQGAYNTAENIMAGYNAGKIDADTIQDRRDTINESLGKFDKYDPSSPKFDVDKYNQQIDKLSALDEFEKINNIALDKTETIFDDESLAKDPSYKSLDEKIKEGLLEGDDDDDDFDPLGPLNLDTTTAPAFKNFYNDNPFEINNIVDYQKTKDLIEEARLRDLDAMDPNPGTDNKGFDPGVNPGESGFIGLDENMDVSPFKYDDYGTYEGPGGYNPGSGNYNAGQAAQNAQNEALQNAANMGMSINEAKASVGMPENLGDTGGSESNAGKIVCTMMNESYGFGSFRNKIWMKFHKNLSPEYQKGYHKLFLPLVKIAKTNKVVKKILEHIAVHSTIDMRQATRGKMHLLGRIYRKILLPLCYFVGKHGKSSS